MKKLLVFIIIACTVLSLASCNGTSTQSGNGTANNEAEAPAPAPLPENAIEVLSAYPTLTYITPGEFDISKTEDSTWARYGYRAYVGTYDGKLVIMPSHNDGSSYVSGVSRDTTFSSFNLFGDKTGIYLGSERIIDGECKGIILTPSKKTAIVLASSGEGSTAYIFNKDNADGDFDRAFTEQRLDGEIALYYLDSSDGAVSLPKDLYILTSSNVYVMKNYSSISSATTADSQYRLVTVDTPDWWSHASLLNAAMTSDGTLFVGEFDGVIGIKDAVITYYPLSYGKYRS